MPIITVGETNYLRKWSDEGDLEETAGPAATNANTVAAMLSAAFIVGQQRSLSISHRFYDFDLNPIGSGDHGAEVRAIVVDSQQNIWLGGDNETLRKVDKDGNEILTISISSGATWPCLSLAVDDSDRVYIGSSVYGSPSRTLLSVNADGTGRSPAWRFNHGDNVNTIVLDNDGYVYIGGTRSSNVSIRKIDPDGDEVWSFDTGGNVIGLAIFNERLYATGTRVSNKTAWKFDLNGNEIIDESWPVDHGDLGRKIAIGNGFIYITGNRTSNVTTRKYNETGGQITSGWPIDHGGTARSLVYIPAPPITLSPGLPLPFALGAPTWAYTHSPAGLLLPVGLGLPELSTPPMPPAPDPALRAVYRLYLSEAGGSDLLELPLAALECRRRANESTWLALTVPAVTEARLAAIVERLQGEAVIYAGVATPSGETLGEFLRATLTEIAADRDESASGATLTARVIPTPFAAGSYTLQSVSERGADGGRRTVTCAVDPRIRPNDTVDDGNSSWTAGIITYRIDPTTAAMRITEKL